MKQPTSVETAEAKPNFAPVPGSDAATPRTNEEVRLCRVKSSASGDMVGADFAMKLELENRALREGCSKIARSIGNGSAISPDASVDFLTNALADEVKLVCDDLRRQIQRVNAHQNNT